MGHGDRSGEVHRLQGVTACYAEKTSPVGEGEITRARDTWIRIER